MPWISKSKLEEFEKSKRRLEKELKMVQNRAFLFDIKRVGRKNHLTFAKGAQIHVIETMGLLGDDVDSWRKTLLK